MKRRKFLGLLSGAAAAAGLVKGSQVVGSSVEEVISDDPQPSELSKYLVDDLVQRHPKSDNDNTVVSNSAEITVGRLDSDSVLRKRQTVVTTNDNTLPDVNNVCITLGDKTEYIDLFWEVGPNRSVGWQENSVIVNKDSGRKRERLVAYPPRRNYDARPIGLMDPPEIRQW